MIDPGWNYPNVSGSSGNPITMRALNDGTVWIDGQFARRPVYLSNNKWIILEGFNAYNGTDKVVVIGSGTSNVTVRRVIAWSNSDSVPNAEETFLVAGPNNIVEDCAAFGTGRKVLSAVQTGNDVIFRRCWVKFEEHPRAQTSNHPDSTMEMGYNAVRQTFENMIGNWNEQYADETEAILNIFSRPEYLGPAYPMYSKFLGSIAYLKRSDVYSPGHLVLAHSAIELELNHIVSFVEPGGNAGKMPFSIRNDRSSGTLKISNSVGIGSAVSSNTDGIGSLWQVSNVRQGTSIAAAIGSGKSIFQEVPGICYRYQDAVLTNQPLWPWPMDRRIKEALAFSGHHSVTAGMSNDSGYVTDAMEQLFGQSIPSQCRASGSQDTRALSPPQGLRILVQ